MPAWLCRCSLDSQYSSPVWPLGSRWLSGLMPGIYLSIPSHTHTQGAAEGGGGPGAPSGALPRRPAPKYSPRPPPVPDTPRFAVASQKHNNQTHFYTADDKQGRRAGHLPGGPLQAWRVGSPERAGRRHSTCLRSLRRGQGLARAAPCGASRTTSRLRATRAPCRWRVRVWSSEATLKPAADGSTLLIPY